ncbi:MAG: galactokinase [Chitinophagales bacterium]
MNTIKNPSKLSETIIAEASGRINIIGEHTDYNDGFVLPASIDKRMTVKIKRNSTASQASVTAANLGESFTFDLQNYSPTQNGWYNYVMGVVNELQKMGGKITGFNAEFNGTVPIGSGMSSSASLECAFALALNELFGLGFDKWQLIKASQMAEHNFVGIKCGIMDQFASVMGKKDQVMLLDCRSLEFQYFPLELDNYQLLLLNTNVSHSLASSEYNTRRAECEEGVELLKKQYPFMTNLRDITLEQVTGNIDKIPEHIFRRCHHVVSENQRVLDATKALLNKDYKDLGKLMYQSHFSLQNDYKVSCTELDFLVEQTLDKEYIIGARMMGGGFGGCTINIVEKNKVNEFLEQVSTAYQSHFQIDLTPYEVVIEDGARIVG